VIAESFERIHRSNLVGMGVLPLEFMPGDSAAGLGITGTEIFDLSSLSHLSPAGMLKVSFCTRAGQTREFSVRIRLDTEAELTVFRNGGILPHILRKMAI
jgi:aconitate hydratase